MLIGNGEKEQAAPEDSVLFQRMISCVFQQRRAQIPVDVLFAAAALSSRTQIKADKAEKRASIFRNKTS